MSNRKLLSLYIIGVIILLLTGIALSQERETLQGKVIDVIDGDSIVVLTPENKEVKVRLEHIDAPERNQKFGREATHYLFDKIYGRDVDIVTKGTDRYSRTIASIYWLGENLNKALVREGLAWHYKKYSNDEEYAILEQEARRDKRGLWSQENPTPPWLFRRQ